MLSTAVSLPRELAAASGGVLLSGDRLVLAHETGRWPTLSGSALHVLSHDLFVEAIDDRGRQVPAGTRGEITVSGGGIRSFPPALRTAITRVWTTAVSCGDAMPRLEEFEGRPPVVFRATDEAP